MSVIKNYILQPAWFRLDGGAMFGIIPKPLWDKKKKADELNRINLALRLWLIKSNDRLILIDTGIGEYHSEKFESNFDIRFETNAIENALKEINYQLSDITDLILSHLHFDHVGGIGQYIDETLRPLLPQVRCHVHEKHLNYAKNPTDRDRGSFQVEHFLPVLDYYRENNQLILYKEDAGEYFKLDENTSLKYQCSFGHTPWMMHPYTNEYIYGADLIPTSAHIKIPWVMGYDIAPGVTTEDKKKFLNFIHDQQLKIIYEHDDEYWGSSVYRNQKNQWDIKESFQQINCLGHSID